MRRFLSVPALLLLLVTAACGGGGASSEQSAAASQAANPTATPAATPEPSENDSLPSFDEGAGDLTGLLPTAVGGLTINYQSLSGSQIENNGDIDDDARAFLDRLNASPSDISMAIGFGSDMSDLQSPKFVSVVAVRVAGADESRLRDEYLSVMRDEDDDSLVSSEPTTVAGKSVYTIDSGGETTAYLYVKNDVLFVVGGTPQDLGVQALSTLP